MTQIPKHRQIPHQLEAHCRVDLDEVEYGSYLWKFILLGTFWVIDPGIKGRFRWELADMLDGALDNLNGVEDEG